MFCFLDCVSSGTGVLRETGRGLDMEKPRLCGFGGALTGSTCADPPGPADSVTRSDLNEECLN